MDIRPIRLFVYLLALTIALTTFVGCAFDPPPQPTATPTVTATETEIPAPTDAPPTDTPTSAPTDTTTPTFTPEPTLTSTTTPSPSRTVFVTPPRITNGRTIRVPILMYHYVSVPPAGADKYRLDLSVTPEAFEAQMDYLVDAGYHAVRLSDLARYLVYGTALPEKPIVLTFDDGYEDNYVNALPVLESHHYVGTFFVITDAVEENRSGYMTWPQLKEMVRAGMEVGSHTLDHIELRGKSRAIQNRQITRSKQILEAQLSMPVTAFSYPAGKYDANSTDLLRLAGYLGAVTEVQGTRQTADGVYELRRIRVRGGYTVADFKYWIKYFGENGR